MNKLQLYITMSKGDFRNVVEINAQPEVKALVGDLRGAVCQVDYQASSKNIFYLMKYTETGVFIIILRTIPDVIGNYLAAWIFAPYSCMISDKDLVSTVEFVAEKVAGHSLTNQVFGEIRQLFNHEYEDNPLAPIFAPSHGKAYAYRYYGGNTGASLGDLIGRFRYQACYLPFAGVLLVDSYISDNVSGTNLTSAPKETMATLLPPETSKADGYKPTIYACPFDVPYLAPMDRTFDIVWTKPGAPNVKQPVTVSKSEMRAPDFEEYTRPVRALSDKPADKGDEEEKAEEADRRSHASLKKEDEPETERTEYEAEHHNEDSESFIDKYSDAINKVLYAAGGFLLGVAVTLMFTCGREDEPIETPHHAQQQIEQSQESSSPETVAEAIISATESQAAEPQPTVVAEEPAPAETVAHPKPEEPKQEQTTSPAKPENDMKAAIAYLDKNSTWKKSEMEKYPALKGLYDDMNKVDRKSIINKWGPKLKASRKFTNIVTHAKLSKKKKARRTPYNSPKTSSIPLQDYLNNMDP
ncbi:MAG: hypothetical protein NC548_47950 [Lachnospiraceae bacterium]|nr:hypothetical protein [Lachnospiraceae bacterium]